MYRPRAGMESVDRGGNVTKLTQQCCIDLSQDPQMIITDILYCIEVSTTVLARPGKSIKPKDNKKQFNFNDTWFSIVSKQDESTLLIDFEVMLKPEIVTYPLDIAVPGFIRSVSYALYYAWWYWVVGQTDLHTAIKHFLSSIPFEWRQCRGPVERITE